MSMSKPILVLNPDLDREALAAEFAIDGRIQIRDVLVAPSASRIADLLTSETPWGISWQAGNDGPHKLRREEAVAMTQNQWQEVYAKLGAAARAGAFAFIYTQYQAYDAQRESWSLDLRHDQLVNDINSTAMLDLVREVTGMSQILWSDAQATLYGQQQFLGFHQDVSDQGWLIAYVLGFAPADWRPDWGGYLNFFDDTGDIIHGYRPRFNALTLFRIPRDHNVSYVPGFAPNGRFAISGWFRDR